MAAHVPVGPASRKKQSCLWIKVQTPAELYMESMFRAAFAVAGGFDLSKSVCNPVAGGFDHCNSQGAIQ
eukprot:scaffold180769_cov18-Tisochrysis_lutea.AAC.1